MGFNLTNIGSGPIKGKHQLSVKMSNGKLKHVNNIEAFKLLKKEDPGAEIVKRKSNREVKRWKK